MIQQLQLLFLLISNWTWHWPFFEATNYAGLGIIFIDSHGSPITVHTQLIPSIVDGCHALLTIESITLLSRTVDHGIDCRVCQLIVYGIN